MYSTVVTTIIKTIVVVNINDTPLAELLKSDSYYQQKQKFMHDFRRKCEQARPLQTVNQ